MDDVPAFQLRPTSRDLYDAISQLRERMDHRFDNLDARLRVVEITQTSDRARDVARDEMLDEEREIRAEQGVARRWLVALAVGVVSSVALGLFGALGHGG